MTPLAPFRCLLEKRVLTFCLLVNHKFRANFSTLRKGMNVNISNEFNFSEIHRAMNRSESLAKLGSFTLHGTHCGS